MAPQQKTQLISGVNTALLTFIFGFVAWTNSKVSSADERLARIEEKFINNDSRFYKMQGSLEQNDAGDRAIRDRVITLEGILISDNKKRIR